MIQRISLYGLAFILLSAGILHFLFPHIYMKIMPDYLSYHRELVFISGAAEIILAIGLIIEKFRKISAWGAILLFIAVFPANIYHVTSGGAGMTLPLWVAWVRLPIQFLLIYWAYKHTRSNDTSSIT